MLNPLVPAILQFVVVRGPGYFDGGRSVVVASSGFGGRASAAVRSKPSTATLPNSSACPDVRFSSLLTTGSLLMRHVVSKAILVPQAAG